MESQQKWYPESLEPWYRGIRNIQICMKFGEAIAALTCQAIRSSWQLFEGACCRILFLEKLTLNCIITYLGTNLNKAQPMFCSLVNLMHDQHSSGHNLRKWWRWSPEFWLFLFSPVSMVIHRFIPSTFRGTSMTFLSLFQGFACFLGALLVELVYLISKGKISFTIWLYTLNWWLGSWETKP